MSLGMYRASVPVFRQSLAALSSSLRKAEAHAAAQRMDATNLLTTRLYPNMYSLTQQVHAAVRQALWTCSLLAGEERREAPALEDRFEALQSAISQTLEVLGAYEPFQIDGSEDRQIALVLPSRTFEMSGERHLLVFALPNFYFHVSVAHAILRHCGVELNKGDFLGPL
jgi:hypothetical protein